MHGLRSKQRDKKKGKNRKERSLQYFFSSVSYPKDWMAVIKYPKRNKLVGKRHNIFFIFEQTDNQHIAFHTFENNVVTLQSSFLRLSSSSLQFLYFFILFISDKNVHHLSFSLNLELKSNSKFKAKRILEKKSNMHA